VRRIFVLFFLLLTNAFCQSGLYDHISEKKFKDYVYHYAHVYNTPAKIKLYQDRCWEMWSHHYRHLNPMILLNIGWVESQYRDWGISKDQAHGTWQIRPANWMHLLNYVDDGYLPKHWNLSLMSFKEKCRFFHYIPWNFEMMCLIMDAHYKKYKSYELAVLAYRYGDAPWNYVFNWRRKNMWYWRSEDYYQGVFSNINIFLLIDDSINLITLEAMD
jgi:hypothetical protein